MDHSRDRGRQSRRNGRRWTTWRETAVANRPRRRPEIDGCARDIPQIAHITMQVAAIGAGAGMGDLVSVMVRRDSCARPVRRQMQTACTKCRLVRKQPGFRRRARRESVERKLDAEFPAGGMDLQDLVG